MTTRHICPGAIPSVLLQSLGIVLVFFFPAIATWQPKATGWQEGRVVAIETVASQAIQAWADGLFGP